MYQLVEVLRTQRGVVSRSQCLDLGLSSTGIDRLLASGELQRLVPAVYGAVGVPLDVQTRRRAGSLWCAADGALSHLTAAELWGLVGLDPDAKTHVTVRFETDREAQRLFLVHRSRRLPDEHLTQRDGLRVTTVERTLMDLAGLRRSPGLGPAVGAAIRASLTTADALLGVVEEWGAGRRGMPRLRFEARLRSDSDQRESELEDRFWRAIAKSEIPRPVAQFGVEVEGRRFRLDFAWPDHKVVVECDGLGFHGPDRFRADRERRTLLRGAGWRIVEITWWDVVDRPVWVIEQVRQALGEQVCVIRPDDRG
jgi:very-short-patch-repair endonuclease